MNDASLARPSGISLPEKVAFLSSPAAYGSSVASVEAIETHMSWVFLAGPLAYKLKKPVRHAFLDFTTLAARHRNCIAELSLNRRLAPDVYLRLAKLTCDGHGQLALEGAGEVVDWLVVMRRLPRAMMLDRLIVKGELDDAHLDKLADVLVGFYQRAARPPVAPQAYVARLVDEQATNRDVLSRRAFAVDHGRVPLLLARMDAALAQYAPLLAERAAQGRLVDGHGDLRPEHICLRDGVVIFDCLEFSDELRLVDPVDELAYLGLECALLGDAPLGPRLASSVLARMNEHPPPALMDLHGARRAMLRARLALAHLLDPVPRDPGKWEPLAARYLALAEGALDRIAQGKQERR
jgi:aminoglycoside phosphotransferase family enzyme